MVALGSAPLGSGSDIIVEVVHLAAQTSISKSTGSEGQQLVPRGVVEHGRGRAHVERELKLVDGPSGYGE